MIKEFKAFNWDEDNINEFYKDLIEGKINDFKVLIDHNNIVGIFYEVEE